MLMVRILTNNRKTAPIFSRYESFGKAANRITATTIGIMQFMRSHRNADNQKLVMWTPLTN